MARAGGAEAAASNIGAVIQGSGNDILTLRNSCTALITKVTQGGSFVHTGGGSQITQPFNHAYAGSSPIKADFGLQHARAGEELN